MFIKETSRDQHQWKEGDASRREQREVEVEAAAGAQWLLQLSSQRARELEWPMGLYPAHPSITGVGHPGMPVISGEVALQLGWHILPCRGIGGVHPHVHHSSQ